MLLLRCLPLSGRNLRLKNSAKNPQDFGVAESAFLPSGRTLPSCSWQDRLASRLGRSRSWSVAAADLGSVPVSSGAPPFSSAGAPGPRLLPLPGLCLFPVSPGPLRRGTAVTASLIACAGKLEATSSCQVADRATGVTARERLRARSLGAP